MKIIRLIPVILSFLLLGAHFSRDGQPILGLVMLLFPLLLFIKRAWIPKLFQIALALGALEWILSLYFYIEKYQQLGKPWTRILIILVGVALFTALSSLVFQSKIVKDIYSNKPKNKSEE